MLSTNKRIALVLAAVLSGVGAIGLIAWYRSSRGPQATHNQAEYFCPMHPTIVRDRPGECPICGMKLEKRGAPGERRVLFYRHPMDPSIHSDRPARDDMGMDYVPVYADEAQGGSAVEGRAAVKVPPERAQLLGIRSVPVGSAFTGGAVSTVGRVAMDERRREVVHAKYEGYVEKLLVDFTGKPVRKGQPLLAIYSPEDAESERVRDIVAPFGALSIQRYLASGIQSMI